MKAIEVVRINENQATGRVFFHLKNGATVCRTMTSGEVQRGQIIRKKSGQDAVNSYFVDLFNEKYAEPQEYIKPSVSDARFFEKYTLAKTRGY